MPLGWWFDRSPKPVALRAKTVVEVVGAGVGVVVVVGFKSRVTHTQTKDTPADGLSAQPAPSHPTTLAASLVPATPGAPPAPVGVSLLPIGRDAVETLRGNGFESGHNGQHKSLHV